MVNQNKIFSFKIKRHAKNFFQSDVERMVRPHHNSFKYSHILTPYLDKLLL